MGLRLTLVVLATLLAMFTVINAGNYTDIPTTCKFVNGTDGYRDKNEPGPVSRFAMKMEIAFTKPCFRLLKELVEATRKYMQTNSRRIESAG